MEPVIFMLCFSLHNTEEALWLTEWRKTTMPDNEKPHDAQQFIFSVLGLTILGYLASGLFILFPNNDLLEFCFIGFVGTTLIDAVASHIFLSIKYRKYHPGVLSSCLLMIPLDTVILYNDAVSNLKISEMLISTLFIGIVFLVAVPAFEHLGKRLLKDILIK